MNSLTWNIMGLIAGTMVLIGVVLLYLFLKSDEAAEQGLTIGNFIASPGFGMIMLGLVMHHVSSRARKKIKKQKKEQGF
ncbi:MAG: hypothetical protein OEY94_07565 [Alphaproteobacteria bacterium]|nr:hypothetical protein [Alphaproteobacteria bacterium]